MVKKIYTRIFDEDERVVPKCVIPNNDNTKSTFVDQHRIPVTKRIYGDYSYNEFKKIRIKRKDKTVDETPKVKKMGKK